ncbi:hypothetical protein L914_02738, partial [Phytophthora nicotianae]
LRTEFAVRLLRRGTRAAGSNLRTGIRVRVGVRRCARGGARRRTTRAGRRLRSVGTIIARHAHSLARVAVAVAAGTNADVNPVVHNGGRCTNMNTIHSDNRSSTHTHTSDTWDAYTNTDAIHAHANAIYTHTRYTDTDASNARYADTNAWADVTGAAHSDTSDSRNTHTDTRDTE